MQLTLQCFEDATLKSRYGTSKKYLLPRKWRVQNRQVCVKFWSSRSFCCWSNTSLCRQAQGYYFNIAPTHLCYTWSWNTSPWWMGSWYSNEKSTVCSRSAKVSHGVIASRKEHHITLVMYNTCTTLEN